MHDFLDVAYHEGLIDWTKVPGKGGVVKAGDGYFMPVELVNGTWYFYTSDPNKRWHYDPYFVRNWKGLEGAEVRGAYWFVRLNYDRRLFDPDATMQRQAQLFYEIVSKNGLRSTDYIVADLEQTISQTSYLTFQQRRERVRLFLDECERLFATRPIIYTYPFWWPESIGTAGWELDYKLWIANYGVTKPLIPKPWTKYWAWQYSASGAVAGVPGAVDLNVVGVDYSPVVVQPPTEPSDEEKLDILWAEYKATHP